MLAALSTPDTIVAIVCAVAAVRGAVKGFAWQIVRTVGLIAALWGAFAWNERVGELIAEHVPFVPDAWSDWVALVAILVGLLVLATWFAWMAKGALKTVKLGGLDRLLGFAAGAVMGLVLLTAVFLVWGSAVPASTLEENLSTSLTVPYMTKVVEIVEPVLPEHLRERWGEILHSLDDVVEDQADPAE